MQYRKRRKWKYLVHTKVTYPTGIEVSYHKDSGLVKIDRHGFLTIEKGYAWDGPSGPAIDTKTFMQGSLIHDALYQLMREEVLPQSCRKRADEILRDICIEDGMSRVRAWWVYRAVRMVGVHAQPDLLTAP